MEKESNRYKLRLEEISTYEDKVAGLITTEMFVQMTSDTRPKPIGAKKTL